MIDDDGDGDGDDVDKWSTHIYIFQEVLTQVSGIERERERLQKNMT
jgi:hypothetical protein